MMKKIFQTLCLLLAVNCATACSGTGNNGPLGPIGEAPAEEDPDAEHIYLWPEDNMPTVTNYTVNNGNYQDDPDFRPNMIWYPVPDGTEVKGAVMFCPGGAFMFRSGNEGAPVTERLAELGYQSFVVNYRVVLIRWKKAASTWRAPYTTSAAMPLTTASPPKTLHRSASLPEAFSVATKPCTSMNLWTARRWTMNMYPTRSIKSQPTYAPSA
ncbi:hypothetical protein [Bacteroides sp. An51A]|uniref:hypothetical protein n=1 Tax=Bacteroides sp. An51A TaxID=1965640 RepID=UPI0031B87F27